MSNAYILIVWNVSLERADTTGDEPNEIGAQYGTIVSVQNE